MRPYKKTYPEQQQNLGKPSAKLGSIGNLLLTIGCLIPVLLVAYDVHRNGQNVPYFDDWEDSTEIAIQVSDGKLDVSLFFRQHNEHRIVFTHLMEALVARFAHWNLKIEMIVSMVVASLSLLILLDLLRRQPVPLSKLLVIPITALIFSLRQRQNWLWGFQSQWFFAVLFFLAAVWALKCMPQGWRTLIWAALLSLCATFAFGAGIFVWLPLLGLAWLLGYRRPAHVIFWLGAAAFSLSLFFWHYHVIPTERMTNPFVLLFFVAANVGSPFVDESGAVDVAILLGLFSGLLFVANVIYLRRRGQPWGDLAVWLSLAGWALLSAASSGVNRAAEFGVSYALLSRYVTIAVLFSIGALVISLHVLWHITSQTQKTRRQSWLLIANLTLIGMMGGLYVTGNLKSSQQPAVVRPAERACLLAYPQTRDDSCLHRLNPWLTSSREDVKAPFLEKIDQLAAHGLSVFNDE